jgi:hypothetical protein
MGGPGRLQFTLAIYKGDATGTGPAAFAEFGGKTPLGARFRMDYRTLHAEPL